MLILGRDDLAKYPFMTGAGKYLQDYGFEISQFGTDPALEIIVKTAYERVMTATQGKVYRSEHNNKTTFSEDQMFDVEILSFLIAIVLIKLTKRHTLIQRFALSEARRAEEHLKNDLNIIHNNTMRYNLVRLIFIDMFGMEITQRNDYYLIRISEYLKHSAVFHEREWKLVNRQVVKGYVALTPDKTVRLIRHALTTYIISRIKNSPTPDMIPGLEKIVSKLSTCADQLTPKYEHTGEYPPCIKHAISVLERGENLPHSGRFMLATFLLGRNQTVQQIAPLFKNAPDYNEKTTMYQLNHLSGQFGTTTKYICPSCDKLRTQNLCHATPQCDGIISPMQFGRKKINTTKDDKVESA